MTVRGIKNIANTLMVIGLVGMSYFAGKSQMLAITGAVMTLAGMSTQMFFEAKKFKTKT